MIVDLNLLNENHIDMYHNNVNIMEFYKKKVRDDKP